MLQPMRRTRASTEASKVQIPCVQQVRNSMTFCNRMHSSWMQRMRQHEPQKRVRQLPRHARTEPWARNNCPRMQTSTMCEECGETGHSANRCPIRPSFGRRSHKLQTSHLCPEHVCTLCNGEEEPKVQKNTLCPRAEECRTCKKLFGHVAKDCANANCLGVNVDWFNSLAFFTDVSVTAQRSKQPASHRWHSPANHY